MIDGPVEYLTQWAIGGLELAALATIIGGFTLSLARSLVSFARANDTELYQPFRHLLGRSTLIALELLIAADILRSLVLEPSLQMIGVLAALVAIRTFLSFSIEVELEGCWPWERARIRSRSQQTGD